MSLQNHEHLSGAPSRSATGATDLSTRASRDAHREGKPLNRSLKTAILMVALVGGFYLLREHWDHVAGNWIYLLLLACPLMHLFHGHGGQGGHGHGPGKEG
jgi:hypothetical protein